MFVVWSSGVKPPRSRRLALPVLALAIALPMAGCASKNGQNADGSWPGEQPAQIAGVAPDAGYAPPKRVEMEADGQAPQTPPLVRKAGEPDDPSQPYSPNYGRKDVEPTDPAPQPIKPQGVPVAALKATHIPADRLAGHGDRVAAAAN